MSNLSVYFNVLERDGCMNENKFYILTRKVIVMALVTIYLLLHMSKFVLEFNRFFRQFLNLENITSGHYLYILNLCT